MQYNRLGSTGISVSAIALGGNIFGHFADRKQTAALLGLAEAHGVNLVDTSDSYSDGLSERHIGEALRGRRQNWVIATKCGIRSDELPHGLGRRAQVRAKLEGSLRRLGTDYVDVYQMHHFDPETPLEETLGALDECVREGKARCVGVSNYSGEQLERAGAVGSSKGLAPLASVQCHYHLLRREAEARILPWCREHGVAVLAYGVLARGVLGGRYLYD